MKYILYFVMCLVTTVVAVGGRLFEYTQDAIDLVLFIVHSSLSMPPIKFDRMCELFIKRIKLSHTEFIASSNRIMRFISCFYNTFLLISLFTLKEEGAAYGKKDTGEWCVKL